jgi:hypothetical protein
MKNQKQLQDARINVFWHGMSCILKDKTEIPDEPLVSIFNEGQPKDIGPLIFLQSAMTVWELHYTTC